MSPASFSRSGTRTIVLDDDPTGTQGASGVLVVLEPGVEQLRSALDTEDSFFVQTNSRALDASQAIALVTRVRDAVNQICAETGAQVRFVLRGDSTLRGHVFAESAVFESSTSVLLFVPAFPAGGRTTRDGVHYVETDQGQVPAATTEYARDPVFGFASSELRDYVAEKAGRPSTLVDLPKIRAGMLAAALSSAPHPAVVIADAETDADVELIAAAVKSAWHAGRDVVVRSAAPLAAELAGCSSVGLLTQRLGDERTRILVVCGSHTEGATRQLARLAALDATTHQIDTDAAIADPEAEGTRVGQEALRALRAGRTAVVTSERHRRGEHNSLDHGALVMRALITAARVAVVEADVVVSKGGITAAEVARTTLGATTARVVGQCQPGVSVWRMGSPVRAGASVHQIIVPGNVGGPDALLEACAFAGARLPASPRKVPHE